MYLRGKYLYLDNPLRQYSFPYHKDTDLWPAEHMEQTHSFPIHHQHKYRLGSERNSINRKYITQSVTIQTNVV